MDQTTLKSAIDSNADNIYLGEGDDAANAPVLIDNLMGQTNMIPATSFRCTWNTNCFDAANVTTVKNLVNAHEVAGFSTNVVDYCVSGHTEAATTGAWGYIAQTGGLGGATVPKVYAFKWGRNGWTNSSIAPYANAGSMAGSDATATQSAATPLSQCAGLTPDSELVRCTAAYAIYMTTSGGSNTVTYNGTAFANVGLAGQTVDIRTGSLATTMSSAGSNIMVPLNTLFNSNLDKVNPTATTLIVSRTPMVGGIVAEGTKMLGFNMAAGGFLNGGLPGWNSLENEKQVTSGVNYSTPAVAAYPSPAAVDIMAPVINNTTGTAATGSTTANVVRNTSEPATSKIALTGSDGHVVNLTNGMLNNTILNVDKTTALTGLHEFVTYTGTLTVYDAQANSASTAISFTTSDVTAPVISNVSPANGATIYTDSTTISATLSDTGSGINPAASMIHVDTVMIMSGCTSSATSISCPKTGLTYGDHTIEIIVADLSANPKTSTTTLHVGDNVAPTVGYTSPTGTSNNTSPTITGTVTDPAPTSGINATTGAVLSLDSGLTWPYTCTISAGVISCPVAGPLTGTPATTYNAQIKVTDNSTVPSANTGTSAVTGFTVDTTAPTLTADPLGYQPGNWTKNASPTVSATISGVPGGLHILNTASVSIDSAPCLGAVTYSDILVSCAVTTPLVEGPHSVTFSAEYTAGHMGTATQTVNIDLTNPIISGLSPSGTITTSAPTLIANLGDGTGSGVKSAASAVYLDGSGTALTGCTKSTTQISCPASVSTGNHTFSVYAEDNTGNSTVNNSGSFTLTQINYYWPWYDNNSAIDWLLMANPAGAAADVYYNYHVSNNPMTSWLDNPASGPIAPGASAHSRFLNAPGQLNAGMGMLGGPVTATSTGNKAIASQRSLWKGGNSLEEVLGTEEAKLSDHYYWTWYDNKSPGMFDWVMVSNPSAATIWYRIKIAGVEQTGAVIEGASHGPIGPGLSTNTRFDYKGGPVEVLTFSDVGMTIPTKAIASQRVLTNMGTPSEAFNEVPGIPAIDLTNDYLWTWYDNVSAGAYDWVMIANPNPYAINYRITVKGAVPGQMIEGDATGTIPQDSNVTPRIKNVLDGPVEVKTCKLAFVGDTCPDGNTTDGKSIASQRTLWGPSFEEVPGYPRTALKSDYHWTWYDQLDAGTYNWIHIINTNPGQVYYRITVGGALPSPVVEGLASGTIPGNDLVHPRFLKRGGPVEVKSCSVAFVSGNCPDVTPPTVMTSQRVLWHGYFNEVLGTVLG